VDAYYSSTKLASSDPVNARVGPAGLTINGSQVNREADFYRAAARTFYPGYNRETRVAFRVAANYADWDSCVSAAALQFSQLPTQGDLLFVLTTAQLRLANAVIDSVVATQIVGIGLGFEYAFRGGLFVSEGISAPLGSDIMKTINQALTSGTFSQAITYPVAFASSPTGIVLQLSAPDGGTMFGWQIRESSRTAAGFTVDFDAAVPAPGYKLTGAAFL